jgi:hypothetical protein
MRRSSSSGHATISSAGIDVRVASLAHASSARATKSAALRWGPTFIELEADVCNGSDGSEEQANVLLLASCTSAGRLGE